MHFAYPPRKSSNPPPFRPRSSKLPNLRRNRLKAVVFGLVLFLLLLWLLSGNDLPGPYQEHVPSGWPAVVLVTVIDPTIYRQAYLDTIKMNRELYAKKHGYELLLVDAADYDTQNSPKSWSKVIAMRDALTKYPDCKYVWYLDQHSYIMDPNMSMEGTVLAPKSLEQQMIKDYPVVPPDSIIHTFTHLKAEDAHLIISQDKSGLVVDSMVLRNGDWAKFFVEMWFDPLYRSYNFQKAERHALEHMVQWHPTILSKLALVPQRTFASYSKGNHGDAYQEGDFVAMFAGCTQQGDTSCETDSANFWPKWKSAFGVQ